MIEMVRSRAVPALDFHEVACQSFSRGRRVLLNCFDVHRLLIISDSSVHKPLLRKLALQWPEQNAGERGWPRLQQHGCTSEVSVLPIEPNCDPHQRLRVTEGRINRSVTLADYAKRRSEHGGLASMGATCFPRHRVGGNAVGTASPEPRVHPRHAAASRRRIRSCASVARHGTSVRSSES